jgi:anaerobic magnesium-protoporphyrin IX monomethyl ester cyclase
MKPNIVLCAVSLNYDYLLTRYYYKLPSLGIGYIAAVLEKNGYPVSIIDRAISEPQISDLAQDIIKMKPDIVGFYSVSETFKTVMQILRTVKENLPSVITIVGGPHVYGLPYQGISNEWIDYSFWGEAEESFLKLLECGFDSKELPNIAGLIYKDNGSLKKNPMALIHELDSLPQPARHLYPPLDRYRPSILAYKRLPATGIITSRGCAHRCVFCHSGKGDFKLRFHSPEYVLDEVSRLKRNFGINELIIFDDTFLIHQDRALKICEGFIKDKIDISWSCNARINNLNKNMLGVLKKAGCWLVQIGVESGNQDILRTIKKDITLQQVEEACRLVCDSGLQAKAYFILGHPNETPQTLNDTLNFMLKLPVHYASINFMTPLPGTELWDMSEKYGRVDKNNLEAINYLSDKPAFIPFGLTEELLTNKFKEAYLRFYLNPKTVFRHIRTLRGKEDFKKISMAVSILLALIYNKLLGTKRVRNAK